MAIHCAKDGFSSLKHFRDITGIILSNPQLNWERILVSAKRKKCFRILLISLGLSQKFCGLILNSEIETEITDLSTSQYGNKNVFKVKAKYKTNEIVDIFNREEKILTLSYNKTLVDNLILK